MKSSIEDALIKQSKEMNVDNIYKQSKIIAIHAIDNEYIFNETNTIESAKDIAKFINELKEVLLKELSSPLKEDDLDIVIHAMQNKLIHVSSDPIESANNIGIFAATLLNNLKSN